MKSSLLSPQSIDRIAVFPRFTIMNIPVSLAFLVVAEAQVKSEGKSVTIKVDHLRTSMSNDQESAAAKEGWKRRSIDEFELNGVLTLVYFTRLDQVYQIERGLSWS